MIMANDKFVDYIDPSFFRYKLPLTACINIYTGISIHPYVKIVPIVTYAKKRDYREDKRLNQRKFSGVRDWYTSKHRGFGPIDIPYT